MRSQPHFKGLASVSLRWTVSTSLLLDSADDTSTGLLYDRTGIEDANKEAVNLVQATLMEVSSGGDSFSGSLRPNLRRFAPVGKAFTRLTWYQPQGSFTDALLHMLYFRPRDRETRS